MVTTTALTLLGMMFRHLVLAASFGLLVALGSARSADAQGAPQAWHHARANDCEVADRAAANADAGADEGAKQRAHDAMCTPSEKAFLLAIELFEHSRNEHDLDWTVPGKPRPPEPNVPYSLQNAPAVPGKPRPPEPNVPYSLQNAP